MAKRAYREGLKAEKAGDHLKALFLYAQAAQADANNQGYSQKITALLQSVGLQPRIETTRYPADESTAAVLWALREARANELS